MKCVVLAAGYATRMYPLTIDTPKPLLKIGEKTILNHLLDDIDQIDDIYEHIIISNHLFYNKFKEWEKKQSYKKPLTILDDGTTSNEGRLGAVKDLQFAIEKLNINEDILVVAGDNFVNFSFSKFIDFYKEKNSSCIMYYEENDIEVLKKCGVAIINSDNIVTEMEEKPQNPKTNLAVLPFYIYKSGDLHYIKESIDEGFPHDAPGYFVSYLCKMTKVYAFKMPGKNYDVGDLDSYLRIQKEFSQIKTIT